MIVVCTGATSEAIRRDALRSVRNCQVATMDHAWWSTACKMKLPRMFFRDKLRMMQFVLRNDNKAIMLKADDKSAHTAGMVASFHAMGVNVWSVMRMEEV